MRFICSVVNCSTGTKRPMRLHQFAFHAIGTEVLSSTPAAMGQDCSFRTKPMGSAGRCILHTSERAAEKEQQIGGIDGHALMVTSIPSTSFQEAHAASPWQYACRQSAP